MNKSEINKEIERLKNKIKIIEDNNNYDSQRLKKLGEEIACLIDQLKSNNDILIRGKIVLAQKKYDELFEKIKGKKKEIGELQSKINTLRIRIFKTDT